MSVHSSLSFHRGWQWLLEEAEGCGQCQPELCPPLLGCLAGAVLPPCGCCWECANLEGQMCDLDDTSHFYGRCGAGLECRLDLGDLLHGHVPEPQCVCSSPEAVCGSDNNTYPHVCSFQEAVNTNSSTNLTLAHSGPCQAVPQIVSPPYDVWNVTGEDVIFGCEVFAYPMASIEWWKDGAETFLPGDDPHISIQARGGPRRYAVSGWLQIQGIRSSDGGQYQCRARNQLGEASATARLTSPLNSHTLRHSLTHTHTHTHTTTSEQNLHLYIVFHVVMGLSYYCSLMWQMTRLLSAA
uniref:Kazal type serine peptidase inhibitor domain 1 n=1 Tax=Callorhinchus milii TaxID=7868 RepID=A0A4W3H994_CALMI